MTGANRIARGVGLVGAVLVVAVAVNLFGLFATVGVIGALALVTTIWAWPGDDERSGDIGGSVD